MTISLAAAVEKRWPRTRGYELLPDGANLGAVLEAVQNVERVIVGAVAAERAPHQAALVRALHERAQNPVVIAMRTPYDIIAFPMIETYVCCYGIRPVTMEAVARALFGEITPSGVLPCAIPSFQSE